MDLYEYKWRNRTTYAQIARDLDIEPSYLAIIASKRKKPGRKLARKLEQYTKGQVTAKELLEDNKEHEIK
jgi:predicted nuclease with TOPRIM domain